MCDDLDVRGCDVRVSFDEVGAENGGKELRRCDGVFPCFDVDGVLHGVGGYDDAVVGFGVAANWSEELRKSGERDIIRCFDGTFQEHANCHLSDGLNSSLLITLDLVDADIVLAIAS